jgi:hypothetical protein
LREHSAHRETMAQVPLRNPLTNTVSLLQNSGFKRV